jgi:MFS family permease
MNRIINFAKNRRINVKRGILVFSFMQRLLMNTGINIIGPIIPLIAFELKVGLDYMGAVISIGAVALLITSVGAGFLLELFGFKRIILGGVLLYILGCAGLLFSYSFITFAISYVFLQLGTGIISVATISLVGVRYFKDKSKNILMSNIGLTIGSVIAPLLVSLVISIDMKWQLLFMYIAIPQFLLVLLFIFLKVPKKSSAPKSMRNLLRINKIVASHPYIILCCIVAFLYISTMQTFYTWFTSYFSSMDVKLGASSLILAIYATATLTGMFLKNHLVKYIEDKKLLIASISLSFIFLLSGFLIQNMIAKIILIFLFGVNVAGNFSLTFSLGLNIGSQFSNIVSSLLHTFSNLGVIIFQYLSGYLSEHFSKNSVLYIDLTLLVILIIIIAIMNKRELRYLSINIDTA